MERVDRWAWLNLPRIPSEMLGCSYLLSVNSFNRLKLQNCHEHFWTSLSLSKVLWFHTALHCYLMRFTLFSDKHHEQNKQQDDFTSST